MSNKMIQFISGKLRIISLLFILTTLIIDVNGGPGLSRRSTQVCQSIQPNIRKGILDRIKNLLVEEIGISISLTENVEWKVKYCNSTLGEVTYSIKVTLTQRGKANKEFKYLAYVQRNTIIDVRSRTEINREKKKLKIMQDSKLINSADLSESMENDIKDRILEKLTRTLKTRVTPKNIVKARLEAYDEMANQILYYVNYQNSNEKKTNDNQFIVYVRYRNGEQEITDIKSLREVYRENFENHPLFS